MDVDIITFKRNMDIRTAEFKKILCNDGQILSASQVALCWSNYLELHIEPVGWQAVWKICRTKCTELGINFPVSALVMVKNIIWEELIADVDILALQENSYILSSDQKAPLVNLYPTKQQVEDLIYLNKTACCIDQLRFFYNHLWYPWDEDDDDCSDWVTAHLDLRLQLYYDMECGKIPRELTEKLRNLLEEGKIISEKLKEIESKVEIEEEGNCEVNPVTVCEMMKLHGRLDTIAKEVEILENPMMRKTITLKISQKQPVGNKEKLSKPVSEVHIVWNGGSVKNFMEILEEIKLFVSPTTITRSHNELQAVLDLPDIIGDTVILCPGLFGIRSLGNLEGGGNIKGLKGPICTSIAACDAGRVLMEFSGECAIIEGVTIETHCTQICILVHHGTLIIKNCRLQGSELDSTVQGVVVHSSSIVEIDDCIFSNFGTALVINSHATVSLKNSTISNCNIGIQAYDDARLKLSGSKIVNCKEYGVKFEISRQNLSVHQVGSTNLLDRFGEVRVDTSEIMGNNGDVLIVQNQIKSSDESVPTLCFPFQLKTSEESINHNFVHNSHSDTGTINDSGYCSQNKCINGSKSGKTVSNQAENNNEVYYHQVITEEL